MDSKTLLFSELCAAIGPQSDNVHAAIRFPAKKQSADDTGRFRVYWG